MTVQDTQYYVFYYSFACMLVNGCQMSIPIPRSLISLLILYFHHSIFNSFNPCTRNLFPSDGDLSPKFSLLPLFPS